MTHGPKQARSEPFMNRIFKRRFAGRRRTSCVRPSRPRRPSASSWPGTCRRHSKRSSRHINRRNKHSSRHSRRSSRRSSRRGCRGRRPARPPPWRPSRRRCVLPLRRPAHTAVPPCDPRAPPRSLPAGCSGVVRSLPRAGGAGGREWAGGVPAARVDGAGVPDADRGSAAAPPAARVAPRARVAGGAGAGRARLLLQRKHGGEDVGAAVLAR